MTVTVNLKDGSAEICQKKALQEMLAGPFMKFKIRSLCDPAHLGPLHILAHCWGTPVSSFLKGTVRSTHRLGRGDPLWALVWKLKSQDTFSGFTWDYCPRNLSSLTHQTHYLSSLPFPTPVLASQALGMGNSFWDRGSPTFRQNISKWNAPLLGGRLPQSWHPAILQLSYMGVRGEGNSRAGSAEMTSLEKALQESEGHRAAVLWPQKSEDFKQLMFSSGLF